MAKKDDYITRWGENLVDRGLRKKLIYLILILTCAMLLNCQLVNSLTPLTATLRPIEEAETLCLKFEGNSNYVKEVVLRETLSNFLEPLGVEVIGGDSAVCDAEMTIDVKLLPRSHTYNKGDYFNREYVECFTGATAKGKLVFQMAGRATRRFQINGKKDPPLNTYSCPTEDEAPFADVASKDIFLAIYELWGTDALPVAVRRAGYIDDQAFYDTVESIYEEEGPKALSTAPELINILEDRISSDSTKLASNALKMVSGEDYGYDLDAWRQWWSEQSVSPTQLAVAPQTQPVAATPSQPVVASPSQPIAAQPEGVILIANPECNKPLILSKDKVTVRVRWGAKTPELAESNADQMKIVLLLDGQDLGDVGSYRQPAESYSSVKEYQCGPSEPIYWVHWDVPVGWLSPGAHTIAVDYILEESISDGFKTYPKGPIGILETTFDVPY